MVTEAALGLLRIESEAARRELLTPILNCGDLACRNRLTGLATGNDLTTLTTTIGGLSGPQIRALHAALQRRT
jgi:hypothetical protein